MSRVRNNNEWQRWLEAAIDDVSDMQDDCRVLKEWGNFAQEGFLGGGESERPRVGRSEQLTETFLY